MTELPAGATTLSLNVETPAGERPEAPGLVVIFAGGRAQRRAIPIDVSLELGRLDFVDRDQQDPLVSRRHVRVERAAAGLLVTDLESRNGSFSYGQRISGQMLLRFGSTLRIGGVVLLAVADAAPFKATAHPAPAGIVSGPLLAEALQTIALLQRAGTLSSLLFTGETGTGKEIAARFFHTSGPDANAPFVAVNCATIPKELAERLLFGSRRGAFSGATDAAGHVQAAHKGTLFLDEVAELPLEVQGKLLRVLETRDVVRLGATAAEAVDVRLCAATWRDLRAEVAAGRFREDLYYRLGQPQVGLPALRERIDEIPWHVQEVLKASGADGLEISAEFIDACAARPWPGNVRELRAEVRRAQACCQAQGTPSLTAAALLPSAGRAIERPAPVVTSAGAGSTAAPAPPTEIPKDEIAAALSAEKGNVVAAARRLGIDRNRIRRWLLRHALEPSRFKA